MIVVVILGILAAIAIPLYMKFVQQSKTGEAQGNLAKIASLAEQHYAKSASQTGDSTVHPGTARVLSAKVPNTARTSSASCADSPAVNDESVPRDSTLVVKASYQPAINEWPCVTTGAGICAPADETAWSQMKFEISSPIRYVYCYEANVPDDGLQTFMVVASGDLDGDSAWSRFERRGEVSADDGAIRVGPLGVTDEDE